VLREPLPRVRLERPPLLPRLLLRVLPPRLLDPPPIEERLVLLELRLELRPGELPPLRDPPRLAARLVPPRLELLPPVTRLLGVRSSSSSRRIVSRSSSGPIAPERLDPERPPCGRAPGSSSSSRRESAVRPPDPPPNSSSSQSSPRPPWLA